MCGIEILCATEKKTNCATNCTGKGKPDRSKDATALSAPSSGRGIPRFFLARHKEEGKSLINSGL
jgi:hypothetical protein